MEIQIHVLYCLLYKHLRRDQPTADFALKVKNQVHGITLLYAFLKGQHVRVRLQ